MKKLTLLLALLLVSQLGHTAPPTRTFDYVPNTTIRSTDVERNEDNIFEYLQAGVDTYAPLSIKDAAVANNAAIKESKLDLSTIAQDVTFTGSVSLSTITDLGTVTTGVFTGIAINGGSINNTPIGGTTPSTGNFTTLEADSLQLDSSNQGDIYYDNGDTGFTRLTPGTNGQVLTTGGAGANPSWTTAGGGAWSLDTFTQHEGADFDANAVSTSVTFAEDTSYRYIVQGFLETDGSPENGTIINLQLAMISPAGSAHEYISLIEHAAQGGSRTDSFASSTGTSAFVLSSESMDFDTTDADRLYITLDCLMRYESSLLGGHCYLIQHAQKGTQEFLNSRTTTGYDGTGTAPNRFELFTTGETGDVLFTGGEWVWTLQES